MPRKTRVRTGCMTCRTRKVKRDESKPYCGNCIRLNKACIYQPPGFIDYLEKTRSADRGSEGGDAVQWQISSNATTYVDPAVDDPDGNYLESPGMAMTTQVPTLTVEDDLSYANLSWGEWGDPFLSATFGLRTQDQLLQTSPGQHSLPNDLSPAPDSDYSFFLSMVDPPFITPWDSVDWDLAEGFMAQLATTTSAISASIQAIETLYQSLDRNGDVSPGLSRYFAAKTLYISLQDDRTCDIELILVTAFLLSCFEIVVQQETVPSLLKQEGTLIQRLEEQPRTQPWSPLARRIISWLYMFHTKAMHLGGRGILSPKIATLLRKEHHISSLTYLRTGQTNAEDIVNDAIQQSLFHFYFELQDISLQASCLNRHHRSRGTMKDEIDVDTISKNIEKQLEFLWQSRPSFLDLPADVTWNVNSPATSSSELKLVACLCRICYHAEIIYHARAYGRSQSNSSLIVTARTAIQEGINQVREGLTIHPAFMWPLFLYAVESTEAGDQGWALNMLQCVSDPWWNPNTIMALAAGVGKEQLKKGERVDSRYLCLEKFGTVPPYM